MYWKLTGQRLHVELSCRPTTTSTVLENRVDMGFIQEHLDHVILTGSERRRGYIIVGGIMLLSLKNNVNSTIPYIRADLRNQFQAADSYHLF